jgi:hypothetical protein
MGTAIDPTNGCQKTTIAMEQASSGKESGHCNQHVTRSKLEKERHLYIVENASYNFSEKRAF